MRVTLRYFAALREVRGTEIEVVELPEGTTAADAYRRTGPSEIPATFAVNATFVPGTTPLHDGDELALLPPLGGG